MTQNSIESLSKTLSNAKTTTETRMTKELERVESNMSTAIKNAENGWQNDLSQVVKKIDTSATDLISQSQKLATQNLDLATNKIQQTTQILTEASEKSEQAVTTLNQTSQTINQTTDALKEAQTTNQQAIDQHGQSLKSQAQASMEQSEQAYQQFYQQLSRRHLKIRSITMLITALMCLPALGLAGWMYYLKIQADNQAERLEMITSHINQTPTEIQALSMIEVFKNNGKEGGILITPKNQQTAFWGENQAKLKTLLVTEADSKNESKLPSSKTSAK